MKVGISSIEKKSVVTVRIVTKVGDEHVFPAMEMAALEHVIKKGENRIPSGTPTLALVNANACALAVPFNLIRRIEVGEDVWWQSP